MRQALSKNELGSRNFSCSSSGAAKQLASCNLQQTQLATCAELCVCSAFVWQHLFFMPRCRLLLQPLTKEWRAIYTPRCKLPAPLPLPLLLLLLLFVAYKLWQCCSHGASNCCCYVVAGNEPFASSVNWVKTNWRVGAIPRAEFV